jgi:hypothetical protein
VELPSPAREALPDAVWEAADQLGGWLTYDEARLLWRYAAAPWCEVGTYAGRSARVLVEFGHGWCVDIEFQPDVAALYPFDVTLLEGDFHGQAHRVGEELGFVYLDADHDYSPTMEAFHLYGRKVVVGGHVAIHDALDYPTGNMGWPGVHQAMVTIIRGHDDWRLVQAADRTVVFQRIA